METAESTHTSHPWHPKLTPYNFLVLFTTIGLGTAKAYAVSQNLLLVATSIEWVTGVIIFSLLFILGLYEAQPQPPHLLKWLLFPDLVHVFFRMVSLSPPEYRSDKLKYTDLNGLRLPITGYRLLTTISVSSFGIAKACFAYQNESQAANAFDWIIGIIITSLLYILGLYENNSVNLMPYLFSVDYFVVSNYVLWLVIHMIGIILSWLATRSLWEFVYDLRVPLKPSFHNAEGLLGFGLFIFSFGWFLFAPLSLIVFSLGLLDKCWNHFPVRVFRTRFLQTVYIRLPSGVLSAWIRWIRKSWPTEFAKILHRIYKNGIWMLLCLVVLVASTGFTLLLIGALCLSCGIFTSTTLDRSLSYKFFEFVAFIPAILVSLGLSAICIYKVVSDLLFDH